MNDLFVTYENSFLIDASSLINTSRDYAPYDNHENNYDKNTVKNVLSSVIKDGLIYILDADPWLIAFAKYHGCTIVTDESPSKDWKIPWICEKNNISCTNTTQFISDLRNKYH